MHYKKINMILSLNNRIVLNLKGNQKEISQLLQNISSNDVNLISNNAILYNLFLSASGKFLFDGFLFLYNDSMHMDCCAKNVDHLMSHIKKYKARTQIQIEITNLKVFSILNSQECQNIQNKYLDNRSNIMGYRIYTEENIPDAKDEIGYHEYRIQNLIPEGSYEMNFEDSFPIYFKMHELNGISLNKGCYIGQETTNRLFRTAEVRKTLLAFESEIKFTEECQNIKFQYGDKVFHNQEECGILCSMYDNKYGFILINKKFEFEKDFSISNQYPIKIIKNQT